MMTHQSNEKHTRTPSPFFLKLLALGGIIVIFIVAGKYFNIQEYLRSGLQWIQGLGAIGVAIFMVTYILATVLFIPGSLLTLGAGLLFGIIGGSISVFIAATLGATCAFLIGRYFARNWVEKQIANHQKFQAIDRAVAKEGFKIVLLTRLSPFFPFNLLNYAFGLTEVSLKDYFFGSIGMIPGTILYVYIGSLAGSLATLGTENQASDPVAQLASWIIGLIATLAVTLYITKIAKKALESEIKPE